MRILGLVVVVYALAAAGSLARGTIYFSNNGRIIIPQRRRVVQPHPPVQQQQPPQPPAPNSPPAANPRTNAVPQAAIVQPPVQQIFNTQPVLVRPAKVFTLAPPHSIKRRTNAPPAVRATRPPSIIEMHYETNDPLLGFQRANADKGFPESQYVMGMRYLSGIGVPKDEDEGMRYLKAAADQGNEKAKAKLREIRKAAQPKEPGSEVAAISPGGAVTPGR